MERNRCPNCEAQLEKLKQGGMCPECNTKLKIADENEDGRIYINNSDIYREPEPQLISDDGYRRIELLYVKNKSKYYRVTYIRTVDRGWMYCPDCWSKMFQNRQLNGKSDIKCKKCKSVIEFVFN